MASCFTAGPHPDLKQEEKTHQQELGISREGRRRAICAPGKEGDTRWGGGGKLQTLVYDILPSRKVPENGARSVCVWGGGGGGGGPLRAVI